MSIEDRLRQAMRSAPEPAATEEAWGRITRRTTRRRRRAWRWLAVVLPVAGAAGAGLGLSGALSPASHPARVAVVPAPSSTESNGSWAAQLSVPSDAAWPHGGPPNYLAFGPATTLTCSAGSGPECYVVVQTDGMEPSPVPITAHPAQSSLYRTSELGSSWEAVSLPPQTWLSSPLSCSSPRRCAAGAVIGGTPGGTPGESGEAVMLTTADAGDHWTSRPMPSDVGLAPVVACPSSGHCVALAWGRQGTDINGIGPESGANRFFVTSVLTTSDGGLTWSVSQLPPVSPSTYYQLSSLVCPGKNSCVALGVRTRMTDQSGGYVQGPTSALVLSSTDGGRSWRSVATSMAMTYTGLACGSRSDCLVIGQASLAQVSNSPPGVMISDSAGRSWTAVASSGLPDEFALPPISVSCSSPERCLVVGEGGMARTSDGGETWTAFQPSPLPSHGYDGISMTSVSCVASGPCLALQDMAYAPPGNGTPANPGPPSARVLIDRPQR
jgi:photosystem II stability/assembly factor-like uncharacterized protein